MTTAAPAPTRLHLIFARAENGVIGRGGTLPWHLPEDLAHFKRVTLGQPVIMGRKTWDGLPERFRPLPGRLNIVVTRQAHWQPAVASPATVRCAASLPQALALCQPAPDAWVIGGAQLYRQALPLAQSATVTEIHHHFDGDAFAPALDKGWRELRRERHIAANGLHYSLVSLVRDPAPDAHALASGTSRCA